MNRISSGLRHERNGARNGSHRGGCRNDRAGQTESFVLAIVIFDTFTLGFITLGFEMVAGRILTPLFGSGIYTWATIISLVVAGLMCGYFIGGFFADLYPSFGLVALIKVLSGLYLLLVYYLAGGDLEGVLSISDDEIVSLFITGFIVCFPPLLVLGMFSPLAVRLVLADPAAAGRVAGGLFALSSLRQHPGNSGHDLSADPELRQPGHYAFVCAVCAGVGRVVGRHLARFAPRRGRYPQSLKLKLRLLALHIRVKHASRFRCARRCDSPDPVRDR